MARHSSTLAWKIPWTEEPSRLQSMGSWRVRHDWATSLSPFTFMHWRRNWHPTPVFLPGESQGRGSLVGCRLWGRAESDTIGATIATALPYQQVGKLLLILRQTTSQIPVFMHPQVYFLLSDSLIFLSNIVGTERLGSLILIVMSLNVNETEYFFQKHPSHSCSLSIKCPLTFAHLNLCLPIIRCFLKSVSTVHISY